MNHRISLQAPPSYPLDASRLKQAAAAVLDHHQRPRSSLAIVIADNKQIRALNHQYRQQDAATDVLAFPTQIPREQSYLGDIVIAYPYAAAQAAQSRVRLDDALCLLVIHAALHLLGYDHDSAANARRMGAAQAAALRRLRIQDSIAAAYAKRPDDEAYPA